MKLGLLLLAVLAWCVGLGRADAISPLSLEGSLRIGTDGGRVTVSWHGQPGYTYGIECAAALGAPWSALPWSEDGAGDRIEVFLDELVNPLPGKSFVRVMATVNGNDSDGDGVLDAFDPTPFENTFAMFPETSGLVNRDATVRLADGLWAVWTFDEVNEIPLDPPNQSFSRHEYADALGNEQRAMDGTSLSFGVGAPLLTEGIYAGRQAADWPYPSLGVFPSQQLGEDVTISMWVKIRPRPAPTGRFTLLSAIHDEGIRLAELSYYPAWETGNGQAQIEIFHTTLGLFPDIRHFDTQNVADINPGLTVLDDDQWHHLAICFADEECRVWIDGQSAAGALDETFLSRPLLEEVDEFFVGASVDPADTATMDGCVDHMIVYDRVLNPQEIEALFNYDSDGDGVSNRAEELAGTDSYVFDP